MMRLDGRRLVRALGVGALVFLLVGGGMGLVMAAGASDGLLVPAPRPGDRAVYTADEVILDSDLAKGGPGYILLDKVVFEWLPERAVLDRDFRMRLSHPLRAEYIFAEGEAFENREVEVIDFDAVTAAPIRRSSGDSYSYKMSTGASINGDGPFSTTVTNHARFDFYAGQLGPCGVMSSLQGRAYTGGAMEVTGACDWPGGSDLHTFLPQEWTGDNGTRSLAFHLASDPRIGAWYDGSSPFPARVHQVMGDFFLEAYTYGRLWDLERVEVQHGTQPYTPVADDGTPADPVPLVPRTPWIIDDTGLGLDLPLGAAYAAALAQPAPPPTVTGTAPPSAGDWLAAHPDGYMPFAMRLETIDRHGQRNPSWLLLWVDGNAWLGKQVFDEPLTVEGLSLPESTGRSIVVRDWTPSWLPSDRAHYFPGIDQLPASIPNPVDLLARYLAADPDQPGNRYGFEFVCRGPDCSRPALFVEVGSQAQEQADLANNFEAGVDTDNTFIDKLRVDQDGRIAARTEMVETKQGILSTTPAASGPGPATSPAAAHAAWVFPVAPAAATGIGLVAILGAALYYFWPAVKGTLGLGLFSRIEDGKVLEHPTRRRIHDAIASEPGIHFQALARKAQVGRGSLEHHLRKLAAADLVTIRRAPGFTCYFVKGSVDRHMLDAAPALRSDGSRAVLKAVAANPGASSRDLAAVLGIAPSTMSYHLKRLETAGLVAPGEKSGVRVTPLGSQAAA